MRPRRAPRRLSPNQIGAWRRFLKAAGKASRDIGRHAPQFEREARKCGDLPLPVGQRNDASCLVVLVRLGKDFPRMKEIERQAQAAAIAALVEQGQAVIDAEERGPAADDRKDVFG